MPPMASSKQEEYMTPKERVCEEGRDEGTCPHKINYKWLSSVTMIILKHNQSSIITRSTLVETEIVY